MKLRKRLVSLVLAFGMLASCLPTAFAEENPPQQNLTQSDQKTAAPTEGTCGENVTWKLAGGTLTISGEGEMYNVPITVDTRISVVPVLRTPTQDVPLFLNTAPM